MPLKPEERTIFNDTKVRQCFSSYRGSFDEILTSLSVATILTDGQRQTILSHVTNDSRIIQILSILPAQLSSLDDLIEAFRLRSETEELADELSDIFVSLHSNIGVATGGQDRLAMVKIKLREKWPRHTTQFTGRIDQLDLLAKWLSVTDTDEHQRDITNTSSVLISCSGLGGIGKTAIAREFVDHYQSQFTFIAWLKSETQDQLEADMMHLALILKIEGQSTDETLDEMKTWLAQNAGWLLVFDNVQELELVEKMTPKYGGHVLITSRRNDSKQWIKNCMKLEVFNLTESSEYIRKQLDAQTYNCQFDIENLADTLGHLPLALVHATAYIRVTGVTINRYLCFYEETKGKILNKELDKFDVPAVLITWKITMKQIMEENTQAQQVLSIMSWLAPDDIPLKLLSSIQFDPDFSGYMELIETCSILAKYSMISIDPKRETAAVHRLVQVAMRLETDTKTSLAQLKTIVDAVMMVYPPETIFEGIEYDVSELRIIFSNLTAILSNTDTVIWDTNQWKTKEGSTEVTQFWNELDFRLLLPLLQNVYIVCNQLGIPKQQLKVLERALKIEEHHYGPDHFLTAITLVNLGNAHGELGNPEKQKELLERALKIFENHYGPDHFQTAITLENLGNAHGELGNTEKKKELLERALKIKENHYGPDHFQTATTLVSLGNLHGELGNTEKQKELLERALKIKQNHYGPDHFQTAITLVNLGNAYGDLGNPEKQKELLERALKIFENHYGPDHFQTAITLENLGNAHGELGNTEKKKELLERALKIKENHYGPDHFQTATTLVSLGNLHGELGNTEKQKELLERALKIFENHYGPDHYQTATTLQSLGNAYGDFGNPEKKKGLLERALKIKQNHYGPDHFQTATTLVSLGNLHGELGNPEKQKELLERALKIFENHYGPDHYQTATTLQSLGNAYGDFGNPEKKKGLLERALKIEENQYGPDHFQTATTLTNLGNAHGELGNPEKKKELLESALKIKENHYGPDHFKTATTLGNLGNAHGELGNPEKQKELLERALKIEENHYGPDHFQTAVTLASLGNAHGNLGNAEKQKELLERALKIFKNHYGPDHFQTAVTLANLGNAHGNLGNAEKQKMLLERALKIFENHYGPDHFQTAVTLANLGNAHGNLGNAEKQKELLERALKIFENHQIIFKQP